MAISLGPAALTAALLGLFATNAIDYTGADGEPRLIAWLPFVLVLVLVLRDTVFEGSFRDGPRNRLPGLDLRDGQVHLRIFDFEPVATTLAIITGLLASGAIDFHDGNGGGSAWAWTVFALALFLSIGGRLSRRPRSRRQEQEHDERTARFWEDTMRGFFERGRR